MATTSENNRRSIVYKPGSWFPIPNLAGDALLRRNDAELRLWLLLCTRGRGRSKDVTLSNADAMRLAGIKREKDFRSARTRLQDDRWISAAPTDASRRVYTYRIEAVALPPSPLPEDDDDGNITVIPREQLAAALSPAPTLNGTENGPKRRANTPAMSGTGARRSATGA